MNITTPTGPIVVSAHTYFLQDSNGSMYIYGGDMDMGSGDAWVTLPAQGYFLDFKSPMTVGQSKGLTVTFSDGTSMTYSYVIVAIENVSTGIGTFETYRIEENTTYNYVNGDQVVESNVEWFVPSLGSIKLVSDATYYSSGVFQFSLNLTATISSTSVSY